MATGHIKLYRSVTEDPLYRREPFTKWQAWCDLILSACYEPGDMFVRGIKVKMKVGCVYKGAIELAERWKWSRGKVERFITYLAEEKRIVLQKSKVISSISIIGFDRYMAEDTEGGDTGMMRQIMQQMDELKDRMDEKDKIELRSEEPKAESKRTPRKKASGTLVTKCREVFEAKYSELFDGEAYYWQAKDAASMLSLTKKITFARNQKNMGTEDGDIVKALSALLDSITDQWMLKNFSVTNIDSQYNEIVAQAREALTIKNSGKDNRQGGQDRRRGNEVTATKAEDYEGTF